MPSRLADKPFFNIVLYAPEIPGNTGSVGRTCVGLNLKLHLIKPYGFELSEKAVRRAGLDYWKHVQLEEYNDWNDFLNRAKPERLFFLSKFATQNIFAAKFKRDDFLVFGSETSGLPKTIHQEYSESCYSLPMHSEHIRSYNLSNTVTAVAFEAYRQTCL